MFKKLATASVASLAVAASFVTAAPSANAGARNGVCEAGELCLYRGAGQGGALVDFVNSQRDYSTGAGCITFVGTNTCVKNNANSVWNRTGKQVFVFYNSDFGGRHDVIPVGARVNLNEFTREDNASHIIGDASLRFPLDTTKARIKARGWCWESKANCHHDYNAADIFAATGTPVVSPVNGTVMTVNPGSASQGATVTVKDKWGRLWYFAHMDNNPGPRVSPRQSVTKGQRLGFVGTDRHAMGTPSHLHIDMRVGVNSRVSCTGAGCARYGFVNNQPLLTNAFARL